MNSATSDLEARRLQKIRAWDFALWEAAGLVAILGIYLCFAIVTIGQGSPLGHDEALYATRAREFLNGDPQATWFLGNRAPGLPLLLTLSWLGNATEPYLRMVVAASGIALIVFTWLMGRLMAGRVPALIAAFGIALTPVVVVAATQVWPDIPGAAVGMAALYFYALGLSHKRFEWWTVLAVVALLAAAILIRFGAPIPLALGFIGLTLWKWPKERERKITVAVVAGMGAVIAWSFLMTPLITGGGIPGRTISVGSSDNPAFQGFNDYWALRSRLVSGSAAIGAIGVVLGLVGSIFDRVLAKAFLWPFVIAVATFAAIAIVVHGEARYLAPVYPWFWIAAGAALHAIGRRLPRVISVSIAVVLAVGLLPLMPRLTDDAQEFNMGFTTIETAARSLNNGGECGVITSYTPQVEWYSNCETVVIHEDQLVVDSPHLPDGPRYLFLVQGGKRQPKDDLLQRYLEETTGEPQSFGPQGQRLRYVEVWQLED